MTTRFIKIKAECVLPVPVEVRDSLDAVAEAGLAALRNLIADNLTTHVPGTVVGSWQSMPSGYRPRRSNVVLAEEIAPGFTHVVDDQDRVTFVEEQTDTHPWDEGKWIFPPDHVLHRMESRYRAAYLREGEDVVKKQFELDAGDDGEE
jgi:ketosteroid isomerase-like protein